MKKSAVVIIVSALICSMFMTSCGEDKTQQSSVNENSVVSSSVSEVSENSKDEKTEVSEKSKDEKTEVSEESKDEKTEVSEKSETAESVIEEISDPEQVSSIQQIFTMPKAVENFDRVVESLSNDTVTARIFPEGDDTVVIELTAVNEITGDRDMVEAGLEAIVDAGKSNLLQSIKNIEQAMPNIGNVTISVRFFPLSESSSAFSGKFSPAKNSFSSPLIPKRMAQSGRLSASAYTVPSSTPVSTMLRLARKRRDRSSVQSVSGFWSRFNDRRLSSFVSAWIFRI